MRWWVISVLGVLTLAFAAEYPPLLAHVLSYLSQNMRYSSKEPPDTPKPKAEYDFIIVGAGSAGSVLANRLTEINDWNILLIEAGGPEIMMMNIPMLAPMLQFTSANWRYYSEPSKHACMGLKGGRCPLPRGKVMGGSSVLNFMVYARGDARDYDGWAAMGNKGWAWKDVYPYFLKSEDLLIKDNWVQPEKHGKGGYLSVGTAPYKSPLVHAFVKAGVELGYKISDYNSGDISGFSFVQSTIKNGSRMSTSQAFLHPIRKRKNLNVVKYAMVTKIIMEKDRAVGVEYIKNNRRFTVRASKEVILSAGAINSPQLLMLSGIGPRDHLQSLGIKVVKDLPVGYNLMDHPVIGYVIYTVDKPVSAYEEIVTDAKVIDDYIHHRKGLLTITGGLEGVSFVDVFKPPGTKSFPNLEIQFCTSSPLSLPFVNANFGISDEIYNKVYNMNGKKVYSYLMFMTVMHPKSRGRISLRSTDPLAKPRIDIGFFNHPDDVKVLVKGVEFTKNISNTRAFAEFNPKLYDKPIPQCARH
uniref:GMC_OxRdtase_N domain-containing protein n=3 Tax=Rhodnius prolixus TaxID=13249 RepID=T1IF85_RHOPR